MIFQKKNNQRRLSQVCRRAEKKYLSNAQMLSKITPLKLLPVLAPLNPKSDRKYLIKLQIEMINQEAEVQEKSFRTSKLLKKLMLTR